jgi:predicted dehydrogenase
MKIKFGVIGLNHGHIFDMVAGLLKTGKADCLGYFAKESDLQTRMGKVFPQIPLAQNEKEILENPEIQLICSASINNERGTLAVEAMRHKKDFFVDKPAVTTLAQLDEIESTQRATKQSWFVWYGERLKDSTSQRALEMIHAGEIGKVINFIGLGPHKLTKHIRPPWMFVPHQYGGIINDIGIHQIDLFTNLIKEKPQVLSSRVGSFGMQDHAQFEDFGDATLGSSSGTTSYIRVDWFTPEAMPTFGDIRNIIIGTKGMIELRKTVDLAVDNHRFTGRQLLFATHDKEPHRISCEDVKITILEDLIRDVAEKQNRCIPHDLSFAACRATLEAQTNAIKINSKL